MGTSTEILLKSEIVKQFICWIILRRGFRQYPATTTLTDFSGDIDGCLSGDDQLFDTDGDKKLFR